MKNPSYSMYCTLPRAESTLQLLYQEKKREAQLSGWMYLPAQTSFVAET